MLASTPHTLSEHVRCSLNVVHYCSRLPLDSFQNARGHVVVPYAIERLRTAVVKQISMPLHRVPQSKHLSRCSHFVAFELQ